MVPRWVIILFLLIAFLGFLDAAYLTVEHYRGTIPPCSLVEGCERVLTSGYSIVLGVPVALFGALYYLMIAGLTFWYLDRGGVNILRIAAWGTIGGLVASLWFIFVQLFLIHSICLYCMFSAGTSTALFALGMWILSRTSVLNRA